MRSVFRFTLLSAALFAALAPAAATAKPEPEPKITRVRVVKHEHRMELYAGDMLVTAYEVALGDGPWKYKSCEGDRVTPVGRYHVISHEPSRFKIFLRLDYPNAADRARFGVSMHERCSAEDGIGGNIGIHGPALWGEGSGASDRKSLQTAGGIAVDNEFDISDIARRVANGTVVDIED